MMSHSPSFDPVEVDRLRVLAQLTPGGRIRLMLNARELWAVYQALDLLDEKREIGRGKT